MTGQPGADDGGAPSLWAFGPDEAPVAVRNAEALLAHLTMFMGGWPVRRVGDGRTANPDIDVIEHTDGEISVRVSGPGGSEVSCADVFEAANALAGGLIASFVARKPNRICLHAGAARIGNGLAVLLGESLAGKSSVALHLASAGYRLFADDRLAVEAPKDGCAGAQGLCLGLMPKLRLPLPADCGARFAEFVDGYTEIRNEEVAYLKLWDGETASFGEMAPVAALIVLDRRDDGPAQLDSESRAAMVKALLGNCFAPHIEAARLVALVTRIVETCACYRVTFASSREAAAAISGAVRGGRSGTDG